MTKTFLEVFVVLLLNLLVLILATSMIPYVFEAITNIQ